MIPSFGAWSGVLVAALGGAAVGLERQWSGHADGPKARFGGLRTFTLLGTAAGLSGWMWVAGYSGPALVLVGALAAMIVTAYWAASRVDIDATTEMAAVVVLAAGFLAGLGYQRVASGIVAVTTLLLAEKSRLHTWVARLDDIGLRAGLRFGVMAVVVLPLLPEGPIGPLAVRPRAVWLLVLFFSGVSFAGFVARRIVGSDRGYWVTGLLGGLVSSTNVTLSFARLSRTDTASGTALAVGALAANTALFPRVWLATAVLNPGLAARVWVWLAAPFLVAAAVIGLAMRVTKPGGPGLGGSGVRNPLQFGAAIQMAALFQVVLIGVDGVDRLWGRTGVLASAVLLGVTDVDALTVSMSRSPGLALDVAAAAIALGVLTNTVVKCVLAAVLGGPAFRSIAGGALAAVAFAGAASLWWLGR